MESVRNCMLRGRLDLRKQDQLLPLDEIEPASEIVKRFATGAMSFGSISLEAHQTLAIAMNKVYRRNFSSLWAELTLSNCHFVAGRQEQYRRRRRRSRTVFRFTKKVVDQTGSFRKIWRDLFLSGARRRPSDQDGAGRQTWRRRRTTWVPLFFLFFFALFYSCLCCFSYKVTADIAKTRHSIPGVGLISPPPHHDIYSIEDLAELIYDLKCANPQARISVKLVSEVCTYVIFNFAK